MIKISVYYPNSPGSTFNHAYYADVHCPLVVKSLKPYGCHRVEIEKGVTEVDAAAALAGSLPEAPPTYVAIGHIVMDNATGFRKGMAEVGHVFVSDISNYTNITPHLQINEIVA